MRGFNNILKYQDFENQGETKILVQLERDCRHIAIT